MTTRKNRARKRDFGHADHTSQVGFLDEKGCGAANEKKLADLRAKRIKGERVNHTKEFQHIPCKIPLPYTEEPEPCFFRLHYSVLIERWSSTSLKKCESKCVSSTASVPRNS